MDAMLNPHPAQDGLSCHIACEHLAVRSRRIEADAVDRLIDDAFGPGRYAKTAERLREGNRAVADLSLVAVGSEVLLGAVRVWPVQISGTLGYFLGPIAVAPSARRNGVGQALVREALTRATHLGQGAGFMLLVGEGSFFGPLGFEVVPAGVTLPGPVAAHRVFWTQLTTDEISSLRGQVRVFSVERG